MCPSNTRNVTGACAAIAVGLFAAAAIAAKTLWWLVPAGALLAWHWLYRRQVDRLVVDYERALEAMAAGGQDRRR